MMRNYTETLHCQCRAHCRACRTDAQWRDRVRLSFSVPADWDMVCPHGVTADSLPPPQSARGLGGTVANLSRAAAAGYAKPCPQCHERREELNRLWPNRKKE